VNAKVAVSPVTLLVRNTLKKSPDDALRGREDTPRREGSVILNLNWEPCPKP